MCRLLSKLEQIKYLLFSVKIHVFRVKKFDMLKSENLLKKQKTQNFDVQKINNYKKYRILTS